MDDFARLPTGERRLYFEQAAVAHKSVFFKAVWAKYDEAHPGTFRLVPDEQIIGQLKQDYIAMQPMFFSEPPRFEQILAHLPKLENLINETER